MMLSLAETLGKTLEEIKGLDPEEFALWVEYFKYKNERTQRASKKGNLRGHKPR